MALEAGQIVGDYEVLDSLGAGGMGQVYRVRNVISHRVEALKALKPSMTSEPGFAERFSAEIRILASFDHPNIAQLRTAFQFGQQQLMVMEFIEGSTLDQRARKSALDPSEVIAIARQILSALSYAHGRGVIHRDIKPANVMITAAGRVKLMDFGIAKSASENQLTQPGSTIGSFYYISPEQIRGEAVDARSDVYSVGILLYELLSGRRPFEAETTITLLNQQLNECPRPLNEVNQALPQALNDLVLTALAKNPAQRFQTADAFDRALTGVAERITSSSATRPTVFVPSNTPSTSLANSAPGPSASAPFVPGGPASKAAPMAVPKPHRTIWVLAGALAVVAAFIGALTLAPRFSRTSAKSDSVNQTVTTAPAVLASPSQTPIKPAEAPAAPLNSVLRPTTSPMTAVPGKVIAKRARDEASSGRVSSILPEVRQDTAASRPPEQVASEPSNEQLEQAQDELTKLTSRASAVAGSVERLQQQQAADGLGLRQDMAGAYSRMNSYLHATGNDLAAKNVLALHRHMDLAEKEISTLESLFNK